MIRFSRTLSIVLLVVRLMAGCCTHYAHGCESKHTSSATQNAAILEGQCPESGCDCSHHGPGECQRPKCSLASPRRPLGSSSSPPLQASFAGLPNAYFSRLATSLHQQSRATGRLLLPVRLHLANQVLLI